MWPPMDGRRGAHPYFARTRCVALIFSSKIMGVPIVIKRLQQLG